MTEIILVIVLAVLFASLGGYREVQILIERMSWAWNDYRSEWYWFTDQNNEKEKNKDSFHISNGAAYVIVSILETLVLYFALKLQWYFLLILPVFFWFFQMYVRNIWMHCILKVKPLLYYLIPVFGKLFKKDK